MFVIVCVYVRVLVNVYVCVCARMFVCKCVKDLERAMEKRKRNELGFEHPGQP